MEWFNPPEHENIDRTVRVNVLMTQMVLDWIEEGAIKAETFYGVEILNEPRGWEDDLWAECRDTYYPDAVKAVRAILPEEHTIVIQQAFRGIQDFYNYMDGEKNIAVDMHEYHAFGEDWNNIAAMENTWDINIDATCDYAPGLQAVRKRFRILIVPGFTSRISLEAKSQNIFLGKKARVSLWNLRSGPIR